MSTLYVNTVLGDSPLAYYRMDEASGTTEYDVSTNGNNGTISGSGVTYSQSGAITADSDKALLLDGTAGDIALPSTLNPNGWSAISVECWVKLSNVTFSSQPTIFASDTSGGTNKGFSLWLDASGAGMHFVIGNGTTNADAHWVTTLSAGTWYHIVGTWNGTTITLYVNGTSRATASLSGTIGASTHTPIIGHNPGASGDYLPATSDEAAIYNYALTSTQVGNHYTNGTAANTVLYTMPTNTKTRIIQADDINQAVNVLNQPSGGQEIGHYILAMPGYTANATLSWYVPSLSRGATPVSVTLDASDIANSGMTTSPANNDHLTANGFHIYDLSNGAQDNPIIGGKYTIQY